MTTTTTTATPTLNGIDTGALTRLVAGIKADPARGMTRFSVATRWLGDGPASETRVDGWEIGGERKPKDFAIRIDEPPELLGRNAEANPQEYLMAAMNACILATYVALCSVEGITLRSLEIETEGEIDLRSFLGIDASVKPGYDSIRYRVRIESDGTPEQLRKVHRMVCATSPNYFNLASAVRLEPELILE